MGGRLTVNIISSERAGESLPTEARYERTAEAMALLRSFWNDDEVHHDGHWWRYDLDTEPTRTAHAAADVLRRHLRARPGRSPPSTPTAT